MEEYVKISRHDYDKLIVSYKECIDENKKLKNDIIDSYKEKKPIIFGSDKYHFLPSSENEKQLIDNLKNNNQWINCQLSILKDEADRLKRRNENLIFYLGSLCICLSLMLLISLSS